MLKNRYSYKLTPNEVSILSIVINKAFEMAGQTKQRDLQLALLVILKVRSRLAVNIIGSGEVRFSLNQTEALAFHMLYMKRAIANNFLTAQIFTPIDRTL